MNEFSTRVRLYSTPTTPAQVLVGARVAYAVAKDDAAMLSLNLPQNIAGELAGGFYAAVEVRTAFGSWVSPRNNLFVFRQKSRNKKDPTTIADFTAGLFVLDRFVGHKIDPSITVEGEVSWLASSAGGVLADLMDSIPGHGVTRSFTPAVDSNGTAWPAGDIDDKSASLWTPISGVLSTLTDAGYCSWYSQGTELKLLVPGEGVTHQIPIDPRADQIQIDEDFTDTASVFYVVTDTDVPTQTVTRPELGLGPRQAIVTVAGAATAEQALKMAKPVIDAASRPRRQVIVTYDAASLPARPFIDFQVGDNFTVNGELLRLVAVQVTTDETTTVQLTFGELFYTLAAKLAARTATLTLGTGSTTVGRPMPATTPAPAEKPGVPTVPVLSSELAHVRVNYDGMMVTGKPGKTVRGVVAEARVGTSGPWKFVGDEWVQGEMAFAASAIPATVDQTVYVRLRAINTKGVPSDPSAAASVVVQAIKAPDIDSAITDAITANAVAAANAQSTADGKTTVSPFAPAPGDGVGKPAGALWWRKSGAMMVGLWEWTGAPGGAWVSRTFENSVIGQIDIGLGTFGELSGVRLTAESISVSKLLVGNYSNLLDNPQFTAGFAGWAPSSGGTWSVADVGGSWRNTARVVVTGSWTTCGNARIACNPGDQFYVAAGIHDPLAGSGGSARVGVYFRDADGNDLSTGWATQTAASSWSVVSTTVTAPANAKTVQFMFNVTGRTSGTVTFGLPVFSRKADANLIVDGGVFARHLNATEIWADSGFFNTAKANVLSVGSLTGITITGSVVRSASSGQRVQLDTVGLRAYNASNALTASLSADTGGLLLSGTLWTQADIIGRAGLNGYALLLDNGMGLEPARVSAGRHGSGPTFQQKIVATAGGTILEVTPQYVRLDSTGSSQDGLRVSTSGNYTTLRAWHAGQTYWTDLILGRDGTSTLVRSLDIYSRTYTGAANMYITAEGTIGRSTSLKAAKLDVVDEAIDPLAILRVPARSWIDRGSVERAVIEGYDDPAKRQRAFGAVVEEVVDHAPYLVTRDGDGEPNGLAYDRFGVALIPTLRHIIERIHALEGAPAPEWPASPVYDDTAAWAAITEGHE